MQQQQLTKHIKHAGTVFDKFINLGWPHVLSTGVGGQFNDRHQTDKQWQLN
jgi:hypothetical protein